MKASSLTVLLLLAASVLLAGCTDPVTNPEIPVMEIAAGRITASVNAELLDIRTGLKNTSEALSTTGLSGPEAEKILSSNLQRHPWAVSSFAISCDGVVQAGVPKNYAGMAGVDLSNQSAVRKATTNRVPGISGVFPMVEGFNGVAQSYPVVSPSGKYLGYADITYAPEELLARHIEAQAGGTAYDVWVVQTDGTEIYDTTKEEIGKNILTDPVYADPALQAFVTRIVQERSGTGRYTFQDRTWSRNITKTAVWDTAGIDGTEWRVVVTSTGGESGVKAAGTTAPAGIAADARYASLTRFVDRAFVYAQENGKVASLREFNNLSGMFIDGDLYVFAYEMNGTVIALPYQQGLLGTDRREIADTNGVKFIDRLIELAQEGGGSTYYTYPNPKDNYREEFKLASVRPVDSGWFVGSGFYLPGLPARFNQTERDRLVERVKQARAYAHEHGAEKALADFNDRSGAFADGSHYIFAYGFDGTTLALPFQPELIGTNRLNFTDTYGIKIIQWEISTAKQGGGFVYVEYLNPDTGAVGLKLCYVVPVDDKWLVGSGIYTESL